MKKIFCLAAILLICTGYSFQKEPEIKRGPASYACNPAFPVFGPAIPAKDGIAFDQIELFMSQALPAERLFQYI